MDVRSYEDGFYWIKLRSTDRVREADFSLEARNSTPIVAQFSMGGWWLPGLELEMALDDVEVLSDAPLERL